MALKLTKFEDLEDKFFGLPGTTKREKYELEYRKAVFGELVKRLRERKNLTQDELAQRLGMDKSYISRIETNQKQVRLDTFLRVLKALDAKVELRVDMDDMKEKVNLL
ncbi:helix-turn-helix transcriptional regulator [soil metagenome]